MDNDDPMTRFAAAARAGATADHLHERYLDAEASPGPKMRPQPGELERAYGPDVVALARMRPSRHRH